MRTFLSFKWVVIALIAAMLVFGVTRALLARSEQQAQAQIAAAKLQEPTVFKLSAGDVMTAENGTLDTTVTVNGTVQALNSATLKSNMAGTVEAVWVREGQVVQAGQALVQLDTNDARARATQAQQQTKAAKAQLALAERQHDGFAPSGAAGKVAAQQQGCGGSAHQWRPNYPRARAVTPAAMHTAPKMRATRSPSPSKCPPISAANSMDTSRAGATCDSGACCMAYSTST